MKPYVIKINADPKKVRYGRWAHLKKFFKVTL